MSTKVVFTQMEPHELISLIREGVRAELQSESSSSSGPDRDRWISVKEAIALLPVTKSQLYQLSSKKKVATFKIGKPLLFRLGDLIDLFESRRRPSLRELKDTLPAFVPRSTEGGRLKRE